MPVSHVVCCYFGVVIMFVFLLWGRGVAVLCYCFGCCCLMVVLLLGCFMLCLAYADCGVFAFVV